MTVISRWHEMVAASDFAALHDMTAEDATFESPVVHAPQVGGAITVKYLKSAMQLLNNGSFHYVGEWRAEQSAVLEFACETEGVTINGVDMIWWNESQEITRFKVMVRPLKAINLLHRLMSEVLARD
jgi:hypothetical protein